MKSLPPTTTVELGAATLEYLVSGTGSPAIVLINGAGGPIAGWHRVFAELARSGTVFAYNRLGIGKSSKPAEPQTGESMVETLRALLIKAELPPPYVLVGHSFGGLIANLFARRHPEEVAGVVFLDATAPEDVAVMAAHESALQRWLKSAVDLLFGADVFGETTHARRTVELLEQAPPFPAVPLAVVTGGKPALRGLTPARALEARAEHQRRLASLSPRGKQIMAARSGHFPQFSEPELVVRAVRDVIAAARTESVEQGEG
ncbi:MAG TPA: alpha/beta hydrolase [Paucimonas sp.]|nr:alpha/beta hydrolase [Paucimonas sp.]